MDTSFERTDSNEEYLTPPEILKPLGSFDLDPCASIIRPWSTAKTHYTIEDDGLSKNWFGRVWMNPPYGPKTPIWLKKLAAHGNGIALIYARTETQMFFNCIWDGADGILFIKGRLTFYDVYGKKVVCTKGKSKGKIQSAGAPSCLVAYGALNARVLHNCALSGEIKGKFISL